MQNYENHIRWYKPHQFIFLPATLVLFIFSVYKCIAGFKTDTEIAILWLVIAVLVFILSWFSMLVRGHYALTLQNRLVVDEVDFRYYRLTGKLLTQLDYKFQDKQIFALRFAPDEELTGLVQQTIEKDLSADDIKKSIRNWYPDLRRV